MTGWLVVAAVGAATVALKASGPLLLGGRRLPAPVLAVVGLLAPALLAGLIATNTFATGQALVVDARVPGVAAAGVVAWFRAPLIVVVLVAAVVTAAARAAGMA
ncbi:MAG TPA: AzlD domain-containing protein [candidate division Zixibacteria bacterium]|nr:AzlD domain-containing protein [candidate division Zixibacteria bacterium]